MSEKSIEHLVQMANQIVSNIPGATINDKIESAATHMKNFWSPLMKRQIAEYIAEGGKELSPETIQALQKMAG
ncbi:MAG: formate dehydrogenase [Cellvibrionales bacterium]|nr:MAG: formate dehydrogenase [Cellvibrionales bacterium]